MRHRIGGDIHTGFGNPNKCILDNKWSANKNINDLLKRILDDAIGLFFADIDGCDFQIILNDKEFAFVFGYEPAYQYEKLKIIKLSTNKDDSYIWTGEAFGAYGSGIRSKVKRYGEYKYNSKFTRFVDKWYDGMKGNPPTDRRGEE
jgi:hypothetical protein